MRSLVYFVLSPTFPAVKIGHSMHPEQRVRDLQIATPDPLRLIACINPKRRPVHEIERIVHQRLDHYHLAGEWFQMGRGVLRFIRDYGYWWGETRYQLWTFRVLDMCLERIDGEVA